MPDAPPQRPPQINRLLVGVIALCCLIAGITIGVLDSLQNIWCGGFIRVGLLMGALWIAAPTKGRPAAWENVSPIWIVGAAVVIFVARRPQVLVPFLLALFVLGVLIPKITASRK